MKKLSKLKLNQLSKNELEQQKMNALRGGDTCRCGCQCSCECDCKSQSESKDLGDSNWHGNGMDKVVGDSGVGEYKDTNY